MKNLDEYLTIPQIARETGVALMTVYHWVWQRKLPAEKIQGLWRVKREDLEKFLQKRELAEMKHDTLD